MKKQNAKGFGARPASTVYYVVVPTSQGGCLKVGPIPSRSVAYNYAQVVSLDPTFQGQPIRVEEAAA